MSLVFSEAAYKEFEELLTHYPNREAAMLPTLHLARREFKTITPEVMEYLAGLLEVSPIKALDVVSFYTLFPREEEGEYVIQVCSTLSCSLLGSQHILNYLEEKLGIKCGQTTPDKRFTLKKVECLGSCGTAPVIQINDDYYENLTTEKVDQILSSLKSNS
jgi:NADH-quinone oxidoreductase E subunit